MATSMKLPVVVLGQLQEYSLIVDIVTYACFDYYMFSSIDN